MDRSTARLSICLLSGALLLLPGAGNVSVGQPSTTVLKSSLKLVPQLGHADLINGATYSPDAKSIATASEDGTAIIWDVESGLTVRRIDPLWRYENMQSPVAGVSFSSTGKFLYLFSQHWGFVRELRNTATGQRIDWFGEAASPDFSANDKYVLGIDSAVKVWNAVTGSILWSETPQKGFFLTASFSPDDQLVIISSVDDGSDEVPRAPMPVRLRETLTGNLVTRYVENTEKILCIDFWQDKRQALTGGNDGIVRLWDTSNGRLLRRFATHSSAVVSVQFLPDSNRFFAGGSDGVARIWNNSGRAALKVFRKTAEDFSQAELSSNGRFAITNQGASVHLWQVATLTEPPWFTQLTQSQDVTDVSFSPEGELLIIEKYLSSDPKTVRVFELSTGKEVRWLVEKGEVLSSVDFSDDGRSILTGSDDAVARLWDVNTKKVVQRFESHSSMVSNVEVSLHHPYILTSTGNTHLWDATSGKEIRTFDGDGFFSPDGQHVVTRVAQNNEPWTILSDLETGKEYRRFRGWFEVATSDGAFVFTSVGKGENARVTQWDVAGNKEERSFDGLFQASTPGVKQILTLVFKTKNMAYWDTETGARLWHSQYTGPPAPPMMRLSPNGKFMLLTAQLANSAGLYSAENGKFIKRFTTRELGGGEAMSAAAFSPDSSQLILGFNWGGDPVLIESATGKTIRRLETNKLGFYEPEFSADSRLIVAITDGPAGLWEAGTGRRIDTFGFDVTHVSFSSADGRQILLGPNANPSVFKDNLLVVTGNQEGAVQIWTGSGTPKLVCSLYSFSNNSWAVVDEIGRFDTNDLEEVRSLHWVLPDEPMRPLPIEILMRQLYEPRLLPRTLAEEPITSEIPSLLRLNRTQPQVTILNVQPSGPGQVSVEVEVKEQRKGLPAGDKRAGVYDLQLFREGQLVGHLPSTSGRLNVNPGTGRHVFTFPEVRLPQHNQEGKVEFSAYAFNSDRIKSATSRKIYSYERWPLAPPPRAYLVTVGINTFESARITSLLFPSNDARRIRDSLSEKLIGTQRYRRGDVVRIPLIGDFEGRNDETVIRPTKENFKTVLRLLAGRRVPTGSLLSIPQEIVNSIKPVTPDDLVLISFSTHGEADDRGNFYLYPFDTGQSEESTELRKHLISSEELSEWLRDIDAGELVMILDACHSGAAPGAGFKPGPMGSRGLGQLAYDKGMRILAATQADNVALGSGESAGGLLTTALIRDGIENGEAATNGRILLGGWLNYGTRRVPLIYQQEIPEEDRQKLQQPGLFDFSKRKKDLIIAVLE